MFLARMVRQLQDIELHLMFLFRHLARYFIFLVQNKVPKQNDTPLLRPDGCPALLDNSGGCGTRCAQTVLAETPELPALLGL